MNEEIQIQGFGFSELYEWAIVPDPEIRFAKFVTFNKEVPTTIETYGKSANDIVLGVTTINSVIDSDDPNDWHLRYKTTEIGDILLQKERLAVGTKQYDENLEMPYIKTFPWEHLIRIQNENYDTTKDYVKRSNRQEWVRVNLMGKVIVKDNGECKPGEYCTPYVGKIKEMYGTAVPATEKTNKNRFYVLSRITDDTIVILNKNI